MKIILKEYLASLKERGDLDRSVLPNLLSEIGLRVLSTPMIGTRQNGVDIAAVGKIKDEDKKRYLYLFCIKAGNISRSDWSTGIQTVCPELDEIRDVYLRTNVAREYSNLPIKICLCCGGELEESALTNWAGYTDRYTTDNISYEEWNGDRLAELMMRCLLARELLDDDPRRNFQKAVAMVNEPNVCYDYTRAFLRNLLQEERTSQKGQILALRQSFICLHAVISWAIQANNLEGAYRISELGMLYCWNAIRKKQPWINRTRHNESMMFIMDQFLMLYLKASEMYFQKTAYAHCRTLHALSVAVNSRESVDVNLAMYELLGRLAVRGIWTELLSRTIKDANSGILASLAESTNLALNTMVSMINSNPTLCSPVRDDHMIEIALVMYLAQLTQTESRFQSWIKLISRRITFALVANAAYPTCLSDYADLLAHPKSADQSYLDEACAGSVLYPYVYFWMRSIADENEVKEFTEALKSKVPSCTHQAWFPDEDSDDLIWCGDTFHGICVTGLSPHHEHHVLAETLNKALEVCKAICNLSAVNAGLIPLFLTACRHYRLPVPPNFWFLLR